MESEKESKTWLNKLESLHPYETMLYLGMLGSGLIFLFLTVAFLFSILNQLEGLGGRIPISFLISTFLLMVSGYSATKMRLYYNEEKTQKIIQSLRNTLILGTLFTLLQFLGWVELQSMNIDFRGIPSGSFLYLLSGIHIFHLLGAMIFAFILWIQLRKTKKDGIQRLIVFTNPFEKMRIRLFTIYWQFMDGIWLILFLLFVLSF
ncbi:cytochrome c oxidase subunit 3 [Algoriphagus sp. CAU 1675]|uniref:cytochrome c oxidase subunit 3 n=1 Tax=Algoriphagus sp. CAU 1675 TaxID=3032597 RepID=UPI0023DA57BB|nr:cytochrome c oxidase subunit 3 [Algoriphagus sp. CAU 1675]MDF2156564.1 cytochrome c oxidase subunit 3 [Algoriphagus sp. CAU 1675]